MSVYRTIGPLLKDLFPLPKEVLHKLVKRSQRRCLKIVFICIHVYSPGAGADNQLMSKFVKKSVNSVTCLKFFYPLNDFKNVFPIQTHGRPNLTLP